MMNIVPIKIYEYMAMGKPVIATNLPGLKKEFGNNNGVVYIENPEQTLEKAIYLSENYMIKSEGNKASLCSRDQDWNKITNEFESILKNFLKKNVSVIGN
jgi:glycosyltransferase involved in cell wall biosynthesis